ncbi:MAG: TIGR04282 family arsenosugar biosynthesis glycosyltransferase [Myxococcota bacterium]
MSDLLTMFAKAPVAGRVKTRLQPPLSPEEAAELHRCFLLDQAERLLGREAEELGLTTRVSAALDPDHEAFRIISAMGIAVVPQRGQDLGDRMALAIEEGLAQGHRSVTLIGSDSPTLPMHLLQAAMEGVEEADVVLGPSFDGGFTSITARKPLPVLRRGLPWSSTETLSATVRALKAEDMVVAMVGFWYDVDDVQGVTFVRHHLLGALEAEASAIAPRTASWLRDQAWPLGAKSGR